MDNIKKKSVIIDLNETSRSKPKTNKWLQISIILFTLIAATGSAAYLAYGNKLQTNKETIEPTIKNDTDRQATPATATTIVVIKEPLTSTPTPPPETATAKEPLEVEQAPPHTSIHFESIRQQLNQLLAQAPEAKKPIAIEALEIRLQQAQDIDANAEEIIILQNALAAQSLKSCITYIDTINLKTTNTIQSLNLSDYAPIEWNEYTRLHQTAQPTDDYSNLEHKLAKREQLQQVITIASESLKALA
ncbi:MAG: hypothetical protein ACI8Z5_002531 [Lentimonas sp.]|jgi:hypothetical protein